MGDRNMRGKGAATAAALGGVLIAIALAASPVGATPFTSHSTGQYWYTAFDSNGDGIPSVSALSSGYSTLVGAGECMSGGEWELDPAPSGSCDGVEYRLLPGAFFVCQSEDGDGIVWGAAVNSTACTPLSCFDADNNLLVGCESTVSVENRIDGGTGMYAEATGTFTTTTTSTWSFPGSGTTSEDAVGDITLVGGDPPNDLYIDDPAEGSTQSGIGLVRGWSCLGGKLEVQFSEADGTAIGEPLSLAHGTPRESAVEDLCGDTNNGFAMQINWNILGAGQKTVTLLVNGEERATRNFLVQ